MTDQGKKLADLGIQHCCTANGARNLYHVWDSIITHENDLVKVNLLLDRASAYLDVDSYLPAIGKVELKIKDARAVAVRVPAWCKAEEMIVTVSGERRIVASQGRYIRLEGLKPGDRVRITFPVLERTETRVIGDLPFYVEDAGFKRGRISIPRDQPSRCMQGYLMAPWSKRSALSGRQGRPSGRSFRKYTQHHQGGILGLLGRREAR